MTELIKLAFILAFTIFLLTRKWDLGLILLIDTAIAAVLFAYPILDTLRSMLLGLVATDTLRLVGAVFLMLMLAELLRRTQAMETMVTALQVVIPDSRIVLALIPAVVGLMPMIGGAMFSAPMIHGIGDRIKVSPARKTFINYWFRHTMEYVWPLYTSVLLAATLMGIKPIEFIRASYPLSLTAVASGIIFGLRGIPRSEPSPRGQSTRSAWRDILVSIWPLLLVILTVVALQMDMLISLAAVNALYIAVKRIGLKEWWDILRRSFPLKTFSAIFGVMIFKRVLEDAGAIQVVPQALADLGMPPLVVSFFVPHLIGLLTGTPPAAIALSVPLVAPVLKTTSLDYAVGGVWIFCGAFSGVMISPLHLCLALTKEYFGAKWGQLYRLIAPATATIVAVALALVLWRSQS